MKLKTLKKIIYSFFKNLQETIYVIYDSKFKYKKKDRVLFLDLGANIGQAYNWFSKFFKGENIDFELFEPNPYCFQKLKELKEVRQGKVKIRNLGVGTKNKKVKFYGLNQKNKYSLGGSTLKEHNSLFYTNEQNEFIDVEVIDLGEYLLKKSKKYNKIIVKMDIEGSEVEILENLIQTNNNKLINVLYVEFHSQYRSAKQAEFIKIKELKIINSLKLINTLSTRIWH